MNQENDTISKQDISGLLKEFNNTLNVIGVERLTEILIYSRKNNIHLTEKQLVSANNIIKVVCEEFNITIDDLYSAKRKNNRRNAIGICAMLFQKIADIDLANSAYILKKPDDIVCVYKKEIFTLSPSHQVDIAILTKIKNIELKLNKLKENE